MRIALDITAAVRPKRTGIGWYTAHLVRELPALLGPDDRLLACARLSRWKHRAQRPGLDDPRVSQRWFQGVIGPLGRPDVFHGPDARLPEWERWPLVATVHDVFSLLSDEFANDQFRSHKKSRYHDIARRARRVIFPSDAARRDFLERFPEVEPRAAVVPQGVSPEFVPVAPERVAEVRARLKLPERYALYVGEVSVRKNLPGMARGLQAAGLDLPWVWVGADSFGAAEIVAEVKGVAGVEVVRPGYVAFADLPAVYSGASVVTFVTHHEGFGIPAIEGMACGVPVVVSDRGALPEVAGGCALEAPPDDPGAIGAAVRRIVDDPALAADLKARGLARAAGFTWARTARETLEEYRRALA